MTEVNPAGFLQNAGATHTAEIAREVFNALMSPRSAAGAQRARGGVSPALGTQLNVFQNGTPNMSININAGHAFVPGTENSNQASYCCYNNGVVNKAIAASDPSLPRIDIVVAKVQDSFYSGGTNAWSLAVVTGTAASSPAVPTAPDNSITLAQVAVAAGATTIVNANITDVKPWLNAIGGILPVRSKTERDALTGPYDGFSVWRMDLDLLNIYNGSTWRYFGRGQSDSVATAQATGSTSFVDLATVGPSVTLETGDAVELVLTAGLVNNTVSQYAVMGVAVSGASTIAAADGTSLQNQSTGAGGPQITASWSGLITGLTPGTNTFTCKYRATGGTATFNLRKLYVRAV